ncbi:MAG TPA: ABC transporter permease subunit [Clostridia bacterium]|nr:ABC transporter permease subunit [Clostridia bacterium]
MSLQTLPAAGPRSRPFGARLRRDLLKNGGAYAMVGAVLLYYLLFHYKPMFGAVIAFKQFSPRRGVWGSEWVGLTHFRSFFGSYYFGRVIANTLTISISGLLFGFPVPIVFALLLNEVKKAKFKRAVQTIAYMPHFISLVVVCSMISLFTAETGFVTQIMRWLGYDATGNLLNKSGMFVPIYIISGIWQEMGWNCIIYLSALASVDQELYEAARIDGAGRFKQTVHVTIPGIIGTIILLLILRIGSIMSVGHEKIILLYNDVTRERADVISTYVYRRGLVNGDWSFSTAVGLFNSTINFALVMAANWLSNKYTGLGIW